MITYNELKEKCTCWKGYKRVPGTKPCAEDSCMKEELEKHHVLAFGRMNPITSGHEAVVNKLHSVAKEHGASHSLVVSHSQDAKKNPLTGEQKVAHAKNAFPGTNVSSASKDKPTILHHAAAAHAAGATHLHVVAGSDRHEEMHNLLHKYNGKDSGHGHYNFKKITVHSSGERDPDAEGTTGISASKMREHAASGNKAEFHKGAPSKMKPEHKDAMYNDVRKGMNIKEETMDQQSDRAMQLKRFKDQMTQVNGPNVDTEIANDKKEKDVMTGKLKVKKAPLGSSKEDRDALADVNETLSAAAGAGAWINDFISSTNPKFNNKSKEERRKMAIGAYMAAKARGMKEETIQEGHYEDAEDHLSKANDADAKGDKLAFHGHMADHHDSMSQWHEDKGRSASADKHAEKAEMHSDKYTQLARGVNEGTMQQNGTDQIDTATSAPTASTAKDTTMGKKIKSFKFFNGENDKQMTISQPVKESINDNLHPAGAALLKHIKPEHHNKYKEHLTTDVFTGSYKDRTDVLNAAKKAGHLKEESKKEDPPFDGPYTTSFKKPNNPSRTGMDSARSLAQRAMDQVSKKKPVKEAKDSHEYADGEMTIHQLKQISAHAEWILEMVKPDTDLPEWVQAKITLAADYLSTACDYLHVEMNEEVLDEKSDQARQNKTMKNMMDASRGARFKVQNKLTGDAVRDWDGKHKTAQAQNKAIGRALRNEATTGNPGFGYHGQHKTEHDADEAYKKIHAHVKSLTDSDDKTVKHYLDSAHGRHLVGHETDHDHIKKDFKKFTKYYKPEMHEETAPVGKVQKIALKTAVIKLHPNGVESDTEEGWAKPKKIKEENMKSYKEFLQSLDEKLIGGQKKLDKNHNGKLDKQDFEMLRKEEVEQLDEYETDANGRYVHKGKSYGASYEDPEGAFETKDDMKKPDKKPAGRKSGQRTGSYKPRQTMSKLKAAGATYK